MTNEEFKEKLDSLSNNNYFDDFCQYCFGEINTRPYTINGTAVLNIFTTYFETKGLYIDINSEFYKTGVNWNYQIHWYNDKEEWEEDTTGFKFNPSNLFEGTMMYGDNNEFPKRDNAIRAAIIHCFKLIDEGFKIKYDPS